MIFLLNHGNKRFLLPKCNLSWSRQLGWLPHIQDSKATQPEGKETCFSLPYVMLLQFQCGYLDLHHLKKHQTAPGSPEMELRLSTNAPPHTAMAYPCVCLTPLTPKHLPPTLPTHPFTPTLAKFSCHWFTCCPGRAAGPMSEANACLCTSLPVPEIKCFTALL